MDRRRIVNGLTLMRLPFVALGWWAALAQDGLATITFGLSAVATDIGDGILARRWEVETEWGSNLDSFADFVFYTSLGIWVWYYVPEPVEQHLGLIATYFAFYVILIGVGYLLRRSIAVHTRVSRSAATVAGFSAFWFIGFGYEPWLFFLTALFATADVANRLYSAVRAYARRKRDLEV